MKGGWGGMGSLGWGVYGVCCFRMVYCICCRWCVCDCECFYVIANGVYVIVRDTISPTNTSNTSPPPIHHPPAPLHNTGPPFAH